MLEERGRASTVAERAGIIIGRTLRIGLDIASGFRAGLREGVRTDHEANSWGTDGPAEEDL